MSMRISCRRDGGIFTGDIRILSSFGKKCSV